jgi:hypothetical protein
LITTAETSTENHAKQRRANYWLNAFGYLRFVSSSLCGHIAPKCSAIVLLTEPTVSFAAATQPVALLPSESRKVLVQKIVKYSHL